MIVADPPLCRALTSAGFDVLSLDDRSSATLKGARALVLEGNAGWDRLRRLRLIGVKTGAVIVGAAAPDDRARLEPVTTVVTATPTALAEAVATVTRVRPEGSIRLPSGVVDLDRRRFVRADGEEVGLTDLEARLVAYLAGRAGRAVDRDELQREVWGYARPLATKTVEMTVARLRKKIELDPERPASLLTVRGGGYRAVPVEAPAPPRAAPSSELPGREVELRALLEALRPGAVVALYGPPGVGKTRLGQELAARWPGRAFRVDLDGAEGASLPTALATSIGVLAGGDPVAAVRGALTPNDLVVVDHADEHAREVGLLGTLGPAVLAIARTALGGAGVSVRELRPLEPAAARSLLRGRSGVDLSDAQADALAALLDHLPFAIELAAVPLATLGPDLLRETLEAHGSAWLSGTGARHASVAAAVAWSWDRLEPAGRVALARLSVFRGAFGAPEASALGLALPTLVDLVGRSLIARGPDGFRLLHAVRGHALTVLPEEAAAARTAYVGHLHRLARDLDARLRGFDAAAAFATACARLPDLEHALVNAEDAEAIADLTLLLERVRAASGTLAERLRLVEHALERVSGEPHPRGRLLLRLASLRNTSHPADTTRALEEAQRLLVPWPAPFADATLALAHRRWWSTGPRDGLATLDALPVASLDHRRRLLIEAERWLMRSQVAEVSFERASAALEAIAEALIEEGELADAASIAVHVAHRVGPLHPGRALPLLERMVAWYRAGHDDRTLGRLATILASELASVGRLDDAHASLDLVEARCLRRDPSRLPGVLEQRGELWLRVGDHARARAVLEEAWRLWRGRDSPAAEYGALERLVTLELDAGATDTALARARELVAVAERAANPHLMNHGRLSLATAAVCAQLPEAESILASIEVRYLSEIGQEIAQQLRSAVALAHTLDPAATSDLSPQGSPGTPTGLRLAALSDRALDGDDRALEAATRPEAEPNAEVRVVARAWRSALRG